MRAKRRRERSVDVTASGPPLDSFIHHVHSSNGHCVRVMYVSFSARRARSRNIRETANRKRGCKFSSRDFTDARIYCLIKHPACVHVCENLVINFISHGICRADGIKKVG